SVAAVTATAAATSGVGRATVAGPGSRARTNVQAAASQTHPTAYTKKTCTFAQSTVAGTSGQRRTRRPRTYAPRRRAKNAASRKETMVGRSATYGRVASPATPVATRASAGAAARSRHVR